MGSWVLATLEGRCRVYWRSKLRRRAGEEAFQAELGRQCPPPGRANSVDLALDLAAGLSQLPTREAEVLRRLYLSGESDVEVASIFGMTRSGARKLAQRARERLSRILGSPRPTGR